MENPVRRAILLKLMLKPCLGYSELWDKELDSNKFAYHLKVLETDGLIIKNSSRYELTSEGKKCVVDFDNQSGKKIDLPLTCVLLVVFKGDRILLHHRLKEPFYDWYGFPGTRLRFGERVLDCASRGLKEETSMSADLEIAALYNFRTFNNNKLAYHHTQFIIKCTNPIGDLKTEDREGTFQWATEKEVRAAKLFPDDPHVLDTIKSGQFKIVEMDRFQENDEFVGIKVTAEHIIKKSL
ncbi:MAG: NUDIX domain-containing protein [Candidatus Woesearchaeota archaeon]